MTQANATWYVGRNGQQQGPFDWPTLQSQAAAGAITPADLVWNDGMTEWAYAVTIPGLISTPSALPLDYPPPMLGYGLDDGAIYAGFWRRFAAVVLDGLLMWVVNFCIGFVIGFAIAVAMGRNDELATILASLAGLVAGWLYDALMVSSQTQATLGKMALGMKVVGPDGGRISFGRATGRHYAKILSGMILLIGYLMMLWSDRKQTLHDSLASTFVVVRPR